MIPGRPNSFWLPSGDCVLLRVLPTASASPYQWTLSAPVGTLNATSGPTVEFVATQCGGAALLTVIGVASFIAEVQISVTSCLENPSNVGGPSTVPLILLVGAAVGGAVGAFNLVLARRVAP